jgi:hypothetical protein
LAAAELEIRLLVILVYHAAEGCVCFCSRGRVRGAFAPNGHGAR